MIMTITKLIKRYNISIKEALKTYEDFYDLYNCDEAKAKEMTLKYYAEFKKEDEKYGKK